VISCLASRCSSPAAGAMPPGARVSHVNPEAAVSRYIRKRKRLLSATGSVLHQHGSPVRWRIESCRPANHRSATEEATGGAVVSWSIIRFEMRRSWLRFQVFRNGWNSRCTVKPTEFRQGLLASIATVI
jgi:hypothetical protein